MINLSSIFTKLHKIPLTRTAAYMVFLSATMCAPGKFAQTTPRPTGPLEWPEIKPGDRLVRHSAFSLVFDTLHRQARWVAYVLTSAQATGSEPRANRFYPDPQLPGLTATDADYRKSGYDRGHLAPAADMSWSPGAMRESFYYSNISPQLPAFNRGIWKKLESQVRQWAQTDSVLYVVTGPVLTDSLKSLPGSVVTVPDYFFKALMVYRPGHKKCIGFILRNERSGGPLSAFAVSIDSLERFTGLNFFSALPDHEEELLEKSVCIPCWHFKSLD